MKTNNKINAVINDPLFAGDNKPSRANVNVAIHIQHSWTPEPTKTLRKQIIVDKKNRYVDKLL